ncbi:hypothetical protein SSMG_05927 [Streptomyces sp. AA4]|nr:hypothetical protein SSMG_05927 [Streptomyces sp. AA4]
MPSQAGARPGGRARGSGSIGIFRSGTSFSKLCKSYTDLVWGRANVSETNRFGFGKVTELDRKLAATEVEHARSEGACDGQEAARRLARIRLAGSHAALRAAVEGRASGSPPPLLEAAPGLAFRLWVLVAAVNALIWFGIGVIGGQWDPLWLLWVLLGGGVLVAGVWSVRDFDRRARASAGGAS